jgi:type IV pilus assembly protein PilM
LSSLTTRRSWLGAVRRWLHAMPHPRWVCEVAPDRVVAARSGHFRAAEFLVESLPAGAVVPSAVEPNVVRAEPVRAALRAVLGRAGARGESVALLIPDPAVRVFVLSFEKFPRRADEAAPLLRWRLKKSVPFDVEEAMVSWMQQPAAKSGVEVLVALARTRILQQYEELAEAAGVVPGVVVSTTLATLPLIEDNRPTLLVRLSGTTLTIVIVWGARVVMYRSTELSVDPTRLAPQVLLDEVFPALAYFNDTHHAEVQQIYLAGAGPRFAEFRDALSVEVPARVLSLLSSPAVPAEAAAEAPALADRSLEALIGWMANRGA